MKYLFGILVFNKKKERVVFSAVPPVISKIVLEIDFFHVLILSYINPISLNV